METRDLLDRLDFIKAILIASCRLSLLPRPRSEAGRGGAAVLESEEDSSSFAHNGLQLQLV